VPFAQVKERYEGGSIQLQAFLADMSALQQKGHAQSHDGVPPTFSLTEKGRKALRVNA
jgi:hypothetical protein